MADAFIVDTLRTAGGKRNGKLSAWHPADLAGEVLGGLVDRVGIDPVAIEDVIMGCVGQVSEQAGQIGRNAVMASRLPDSVPAVSIDRQCGSSQQAVQFAAQAVMSGTQDVVIAAGVESMSRVPMFTNFALHMQNGMGIGPVSPRIQERYGVKEFSQFVGAEMVAKKYGLTKDQLDGFAFESHKRAIAAVNANAFANEILPIPVTLPDGTVELHSIDEGIRFDSTFEAIASVRLLMDGGMLSAASSSQICDGASAVMIVSERALKEHNLTPLARIVNLTVSAGDPVIMLEEPIPATAKALKRAGLTIGEIDLYEVNEAFASIPMAWLQATGADPARLNVNGGAIALGHPLGATGTKLMATLVNALRARGLRYGLQTMCEGGGIANVTIIEAL
jgi:acetyl-CoA C-acetyltransferase